MKISVIINVHRGTDINQFHAAADSVLAQDYDDFEFVVVVSDAPKIKTQIESRYGSHSKLTVVTLETDDGLSVARNAGAQAASGDVVVFTDDDIVAELDWLTELRTIYNEYDPAGVGGHVDPLWPSQKPWYFPNEFFWLVGVMHDNFVDTNTPQPVRNTFGCNISFKRDVFLNTGGFRKDLGKNQLNPLQGEEAELCERLDDEFWYTPHALVSHRVDTSQLGFWYLHRRSFWQGYSKAALAKDVSGERSFLSYVVQKSIPNRVLNPSAKHFGEILTLLSLTMAVVLGFSYAKCSQWKKSRD